MIRLDRDEVALVLATVTHPAGFDVDLFGGMLCVRPTDQGVFCVSWDLFCVDDGRPRKDSGERCFNDPRRAVALFCRLRQREQIGVDFEGPSPQPGA